jgi:dipeptidyl aminopeptidase/acylaminoacyl peptidase
VTESHRRHYWRNMAIALGLALLAGSGAVVVFIGVTAAHLTAAAFDPPVIPLNRTPRDAGITDYREVTFTSEDGITLRGWYISSRNGAAVILAHGFGGNRLDLLPEAALLAGHGYGVLLFDFRGHGASDEAQITVGYHEQRDLTAAIDLVSAQPDVDPQRIGAIGFSMGGATLAHVAAWDTRLKAVVIESAFDSQDHVIRDKAGVLGPLTEIPALWAIQRKGIDIGAVRPVDDVCRISPRLVLLIYGDQDRTIPPGAQRAMFAAACGSEETWLVADAGHQNFMEVAPDAYSVRLLDFFARGLSDRQP